MKLGDLKKAYEDQSSIASEITRKLAFAGIAIIWIYKQGNGSSSNVPEELHLPTIFLVLCLFIDLAQYIVGTLIYWRYFRWKEKQRTERNKEFKGSIMLTLPGWIFWVIKIILIIAAYVSLLYYLSVQLGFQETVGS